MRSFVLFFKFFFFFNLNGGFPQTTLLVGMLQDFLFRDWTLGLLLKSKERSIINFFV